MQAKRGERMVRAERIALFQADRDRKPEYNPEEDATKYLLQISSQEYDFLEQDDFSSPTSRQEPQASGRAGRSSRRAAAAQSFTKSHRNWRKNSVNFLSGEEVCVMRKERVVNLSSFLVFENEELRGSLPEVRPKAEEVDSLRPKNSKMLISFMRKRNLSYQREQAEQEEGVGGCGWKRVGSPLQRMNQSCELRREKEEAAVLLPGKGEGSGFAELRATSPNFRNKKVINYFKYRLGRNAEPSRS